ncbi:ABC transporter permease [Streptacidiphilus carbonis]|uniref:ABC transporter permease n=1 Tax=Streptacidiphilus carbonis TaxID=105422 RepID=UPI0006950CF2|nr:ABC transporter permease [Streptacidiphilus carbonis]
MNSARSQHSAWRGIFLVYRREIEARMATKGYLIGLLGTAAVIVALVVGFAPGAPKTYSVAACGAPAGATSSPGAQIHVIGCSGYANAADLVQHKHADAALATAADGRITIVQRGDSPASAKQAAQQIGANWAGTTALQRQHVDLARLRSDTLAAQPSTVTLPTGGHAYNDHGVGAAVAMVLILFMQIFAQGALIAQGVVEEKSTRIVEVLLSTLTPFRLMIGKVAGIGTAALGQVFAMAGALIITEEVRAGHTPALPGPAALASAVAWFLLTFVLFAFLFAAAGSTVSRPEELQSVLTPITLLATAPVGVATAAAGSLDAHWVNVLRYVPPFSGLLMPLQASVHIVTMGQQLLAAAIMAITAFVCAWIGSRVYRNSILRLGATVKWRQALAA